MTLALSTGSAMAAGDSPTRTQMRVFMRQKLSYSQGILEGMALEKFDLIAKNSLLMRNMSQTNSWLRLKNPDFVAQTASFQGNLDALYLAGTDKNLDAATEAYVKVARNCVECHRLVRVDQHVRAVQAEEDKKKK